MILTYFKQAWQLLKQNKLYSSVYILGTGLAIAATMTIAIVYYIKIAPVYPEVNRNRTMTFTSAQIKYLEGGGSSNSSLAWNFVKDYLLPLETPEAVTAIYDSWMDLPQVELSSGQGMMPVHVGYVDDKFWKVFGFDFLDGQPFSEAEFNSGIFSAVISASMANKLFGTPQAAGKRMNLDGNEYRISGVVRDVSYATPTTYADIWVPFTIVPDATEPWAENLLGSLEVYFLLSSADDMDALKAEVNEVVRKINSSQQTFEFGIYDYPTPHWQSVFRQFSSRAIDWGEVIKTIGVLLLALLLVPAVNLAGMVSSRMEKRLSEMGLRKSFGASRGTLLNQILAENFLLTVLGGLVGLILSYIIMYASSSWILTLFDTWITLTPEESNTFYSMDMLFNPVVFLIAFLVCFLLNFLSAVIPAWWGLKKNIVYSLSNNK